VEKKRKTTTSSGEARPDLRDLGDGLILRRATLADADALAALNAEVHADPNVGAVTRHLLAGEAPACGPELFTVVEDTRTGALVSSLCLLSRTWSYAGVQLAVGQPELVGTHPSFRRRGLIRAQIELVHEWSARRGDLAQGIEGIPCFYRQFGYELALPLDGGRVGYRANVPKLQAGQAEPYRVRPATEADLPFLASVHDLSMRRYLISETRGEAVWRYDLLGRIAVDPSRQELRVVETPEGEAVGYLTHGPRLSQGQLRASAYELKTGVSWLAVTPSVVRYLWATGEGYSARDGQELEGFALYLGPEHPVYRVMPSRLPRVVRPYAWYVRVPDVPGFLRRVGPALERRLAKSVAVGHTGELKLSFYRDGVRLAFEKGRLAEVEPWTPTRQERGDAGFPGLTFLQLLFGYRSLEDLEHAFADCRVSTDEARALLEALFPRQPSRV